MWTVMHCPVGNGDMGLLYEGGGNYVTVCIDCNIRAAADDPADSTPDVAKQLRAKVNLDAKKRPYVDVFLLTHPDKDHCAGIERHFYLGDPADYPDDDKPQSEKRILIREIWSSPLVFRRESSKHTLCDDAKAWAKEARRRVEHNRAKKFSGIEHGNRIRVLGEDVDGKTDDLTPILTKAGETITTIAGTYHSFFAAKLLAPMLADDDEEDDLLSKNNSSVVMRFTLTTHENTLYTSKLLIGGDAEVAIWERLHQRYAAADLEYDALVAPHHCSWHSISYDSLSDKGDRAAVSEDAVAALSHLRSCGRILASSNPIVDDECDPPSYRAMQEYKKIVATRDGSFLCTGDSKEPIELISTNKGGFKVAERAAAVRAAVLAVPMPFKPHAATAAVAPAPAHSLSPSRVMSRFPSIRRVLRRMYPSLDLVHDGAATSVIGLYPVMHDGVELDRFHIRVELHPEHPRYCPRVFEIGGRLAPTLEGHFLPDGSACLFHPLVYWTEHFHLRGFADFLRGPVHNFFLYQAAVAAKVPWTHGEVGHDLNSIAAFWTEAFGTTIAETARCAAAFQERQITVRSPCPCGRARATQLCHSRIARLLEHTPPHVLRVLLAPLAAAIAGAA